MAIEGHRIFESKEVMELSEYKVALTGTEQTLMSRRKPPTKQSFDLLVARVKPYLHQLNSDKNMLKLDAKLGPTTMIKCIAAYVVMSEIGLPHAGKSMSSTRLMLEIKEDDL